MNKVEQCNHALRKLGLFEILINRICRRYDRFMLKQTIRYLGGFQVVFVGGIIRYLYF